MSDAGHSMFEMSDETVYGLLRRAMRNTALLGLAAAIVTWIGSNWHNALMLMVGTAISVASIWEWLRLARLVNARLDNQKSPQGATFLVIFFVLRLTIFAGVIYGSLKCLRGSVTALLCGLALALIATAFEALRLLTE